MTLKHFKLLARLGRTPVSLIEVLSQTRLISIFVQSYYLYHSIEEGAEFYFDEDDYISKSDPAKHFVRKKVVKVESPKQTPIPSCTHAGVSGSTARSSRKRPRRTATANVRSYVDHDSDEDAEMSDASVREKKVVRETSMQLWIRHLGELLKSEQKKVSEDEDRMEFPVADL